MKLETERLILRHPKRCDAKYVYYYAKDPEVTKYLTWPTHKSIEDTKQVIARWMKADKLVKKYRYAIIIKGTKEFIGVVDTCNIETGIPEIGITIGHDWWGKGFATEAIKKLIEVLFADGYEKIVIKAETGNVASDKVIRKCGFEFKGQEIEHCTLKDKTAILNTYELQRR